ncbi:MAG: hypothetical protein HQK52_17175 [Oligoflexia bacterium]|nr:hypothetical protein [Oligoflexia bacterium]
MASIRNRGPEIKYSEERKAYYHKGDDFIHLPCANLFKKNEEFYNVLFH